MLGWAMIINNLGRRRYPLHWWSPEPTFVRQSDDTEPGAENEELEAMEEARERHEEGMFQRESISSDRDVVEAGMPEGRPGEGDLNREPPDLEDVFDAQSTQEADRSR